MKVTVPPDWTTPPPVTPETLVTESVSPSGSTSFARMLEVTSVAVSSISAKLSSAAIGASGVPVTTMLIAAVRVCLSFAASYVVEAVPNQFGAGVNV